MKHSFVIFAKEDITHTDVKSITPKADTIYHLDFMSKLSNA